MARAYGYSTFLEGRVGVDVRQQRELTGSERTIRTVVGAGQTALSTVVLAQGLHAVTTPASPAASPANTNPFDGPVSRQVNVVNPNGNVVQVPQGHSLGGSPDGQFLQLRGPTGNYTGLRLDGPHRNVPYNHAHVPGVGGHIPVR